MVYKAALIVSQSKASIPKHLNRAIVEVCSEAIKSRGVFTVALSGGSLPAFLSTINHVFEENGVDPRFESWFVVLADERCVRSTDPDSNLGALQAQLFTSIPVPRSQIFGINEDKLSETTDAVAKDYETIVKSVLGKSGGYLDLAVLGFGPDGHTCSLFPGHALLKEQTAMVAPIEDSPKDPPRRITLTYPVLNTMTRHVIFCGTGDSKAPILQKVFESIIANDDDIVVGGECYTAIMKEPYPYPCGGVLPNSEGTANSLLWVVDRDAMVGVAITPASNL